MQPLEDDDPSFIGPYRLIARLGAGGMGRVYLARNAGGRTVAVKVVRPELADSADFRARFRREVAAAQSVDGAYTAPVVDADRDSATPWLATAYVLGPSLAEAVVTHGPLPEHSVRALGAVLAEALGAIHGAGLIHRDLKPSNVLLAADGPRVIDFGIARALDDSQLTSTGVVVGSPGFMSPEQATGRTVGPEGDVFSLGSVLAFAATGHGPFGQDSAATLLYRVVHETPDLDGLPDQLRPAVEACLAKDPADRPTPARLLAMLAPDGAAVLLRGAWLPTAVASGIARHAATVMELETPAPRNPSPVQDAVVGRDPRLPRPDEQPQHGTVVLGAHPTQQPTPAPSPAPAPAQAPPPAAPSRRKLLLGTFGAAAVALVGGGTALALNRHGTPAPGPAPTPKPTPSTPTAQPSGTSAAPSRPPGVPPQPLWSYTADHALTGPLSVSGGHVLVPGDTLVALDSRSGTKVWSGPKVPGANWMPTVDAVGGTGTGSGGVLVALNQDSDLVGIDSATGAQLWDLYAPNEFSFTNLLGVNKQTAFILGYKYPLDAKGQPVISIDSHNNAVIAVDLRTRKVLWSQLRNSSADYDVIGLVTDDYVVYTNDKNNIVVRSVHDGAQLWSQNFGDPQAPSSVLPVLGGDTVYLPGPQVIGYGLAGGDLRVTSKRAAKGSYEGLVYADGTLYCANMGSNQVVAMDAKTATVTWQGGTPPDFSGASLVTVGDTVFSVAITGDFGGSDELSAIDRRTGKLLWIFKDGIDSTDDWWLSTDGTQLYASHGPHVYALPPR